MSHHDHDDCCHHHHHITEYLKCISETQQEELKVSKHIADTLDKSLQVQTDILSALNTVIGLITPKPSTKSIAVRFIGAQMQPNNTCVLQVGQTSQASILPLLADGVTPSGGTLSNVAYNFSDPSATVVLNPDGLTATVTGVADSGGIAVSGSATCTVTDTDGAVSQWTQSFTIQVNAAPPPDQLTQSVAVQFSDATGGTLAPGLKKPATKRPLNE